MNALAVLSSQERFYEQAREEFEDIVKGMDSDAVLKHLGPQILMDH